MRLRTIGSCSTSKPGFFLHVLCLLFVQGIAFSHEAEEEERAVREIEINKEFKIK